MVIEDICRAGIISLGQGYLLQDRHVLANQCYLVVFDD